MIHYEVSILRLVKHVNIVQLIEDFDYKDHIFLVMELVKVRVLLKNKKSLFIIFDIDFVKLKFKIKFKALIYIPGLPKVSLIMQNVLNFLSITFYCIKFPFFHWWCSFLEYVLFDHIYIFSFRKIQLQKKF